MGRAIRPSDGGGETLTAPVEFAAAKPVGPSLIRLLYVGTPAYAPERVLVEWRDAAVVLTLLARVPAAGVAAAALRAESFLVDLGEDLRGRVIYDGTTGRPSTAQPREEHSVFSKVFAGPGTPLPVEVRQR
jgi:hypothetical protein